MLAIGLLFSILIGVSLGLLGGGGSILTVPTIHYAFGVEVHAAIAASLAVVGTTSLAALIPHARAGRVQWRVGFMFGAASMAGAFAAGKIAKYIPATILLVGFGTMMLVTAAAMLRERRSSGGIGRPHEGNPTRGTLGPRLGASAIRADTPAIDRPRVPRSKVGRIGDSHRHARDRSTSGPREGNPRSKVGRIGASRRHARDRSTSGPVRRTPVALVIVEGLVVGGVTGLVGAGGGFLVVPALVLLGGLGMAEAVGTSLLVIAMKSFAAFAGAAGDVSIDLRLIGMVSVAAIIGSGGGAYLAGRIPGARLQRMFGWFIIVMAVFILGQELPRAFGAAVGLDSAWPWILALVAIAIATGVAVEQRRRIRPDLGRIGS